MKEFTIKAPAKLNFGLQVLNKRNDGYHNINTVFIKIAIYDFLKIKPSTHTKIITNPDYNILLQENLIFKVLKLLSEHFEKPEIMNFEIHLEKNIPIGAGMGGGSSDAAAIFKFINQYFKLTDNTDELIPLAAKIGADVPFFLNKGDAVGTGIGDKLEYFNFDMPMKILVVFPEIHISTPKAYKALNRTDKNYDITDFKKIAENFNQHKIHIQKYVYNDFEVPVFDMHKELLAIKNKLLNSDAGFAIMTGSGSAVFALFDNEEKAIKASELFPQYRTFITNKL